MWRQITPEVLSYPVYTHAAVDLNPLLSFTDGFGKLHMITDDHCFVLVNNAGDWVTHWPQEILMATARALRLSEDVDGNA